MSKRNDCELNLNQSVLSAWKSQVTQASKIPLLHRLFARSSTELFDSFAASYEQLRALPRRVRRSLQRQLARSSGFGSLSTNPDGLPNRRSLQHKLAWSLAGAALLLALGQQVQAANIMVTTKKADIDTTDGLCSLSEAIINANNDTATYADCAAGSGADIIQTPRGTHTIKVTNGPYALPTITSDVTIEGDRTKIVRNRMAAPASVMGTSVSGDLTLNNVTVSGGDSYYSGGGIVNNGTLTLNNSNVSKNTAASDGGGIVNYGTLTVLNSKVERNKAFYGGGIADNGGVTTVEGSTIAKNLGFRGGGVYSTPNSGSDVTITRSTITLNKVDPELYGFSFSRGGGVFNGYGNTLTIESSIFTKNFGDFTGGAIANYDGTLTVLSSTFTGNKAVCAGGGIWSSGDTTIENSTISKNVQTDAYCSGGGGINWSNGFTNGSLTVTNSTISGNKAISGGGITIWSETETVTIENSTITKNQAVRRGGGIWVLPYGVELILNSTLISGNKIKASGSGREVYNVLGYGTVTTDNYSLFGFNGDAGVVGFVPGATDIVPAAGIKINKILSGGLKDNGGPPNASGKANFTHALVTGSPAIDAAPCMLPTDQRGVARPQGPTCDIGAFELAPP